MGQLQNLKNIKIICFLFFFGGALRAIIDQGAPMFVFHGRNTSQR